MTILSVYADHDGTRARLTTSDPEQISATLAASGIDFERWSTEVPVSSRNAAEVLAAYQPRIDELKQRCGYATADVISLEPGHADPVALRQKFLEEHTHAEDEVRFFVAGRGGFYLHVGALVLAIVCEGGDMLRVPANTRHWFDTGPQPDLVAIRLFTNPAGWVARYTDDPIAQRFPRMEPGGLPHV